MAHQSKESTHPTKRSLSFWRPEWLVFALGALLVIGFWFVGQGRGFVPVLALQSLSFNLWSAPQNLLTFWLVHASVGNLLANVALIVLSGFVVVRKVGPAHLLGLFVVCIGLSFSLFNLLEPTVFGIGASGAAVGLTAAALILNPKTGLKLVAVALVVVVLGMVGFAQLDAAYNREMASRQSALSFEVQSAYRSGDQNRLQSAQSALQSVSQTITAKSESDVFARSLPVANLVHIIAAILAVLYLALACPVPLRASLQSSKKLFAFRSGRN
ncbi:MAG: rhomboid family intramembrane serine protease [Candidatus Diapherotrites archaeon]|nr:rhomboid family intramembrane serine protease [Candidatus Diapherotrites archaeon]